MNDDAPRLTSEAADAAARRMAELLGLPYHEHWKGVQIHEDEHRLIVVLPQVYNWRIVEAPPGRAFHWVRAWCYPEPLPAFAAALAWVQDPDAVEPVGWSKSVHDGRRPRDEEHPNADHQATRPPARSALA